MDRDKRRSKEEEDELDKKIALIREKNQKIVERSREVERERVEASGDTVKKEPKSHTPTKNGKDWNREWDHGKTPADTWRENVPSMESVDGPRRNSRGGRRGGGQNGQDGGGHGRGGGGHGGGGGGMQRGRGGHRPGGTTGRLEGRITRESNGDERPAARRQGDGRRKVLNANGGGIKIQIKNIGENGEGAPAKRRERRQPNGGDAAAQKNEEQEQEKRRSTRPRRENDKYVVKQLMRKLVDRVVSTEKREKRMARAAEEQKEGDAEKTENDERVRENGETNEEKKQTTPESNGETKEAEKTVDEEKPVEEPKANGVAENAAAEKVEPTENDVAQKDAASTHAENGEKTPEKETSPEETNNNEKKPETSSSTEELPQEEISVITLQTEKVAVIEQTVVEAQ